MSITNQSEKDAFLWQVLEEMDGWDGVLLPQEMYDFIVDRDGSCCYSVDELEAWLNEENEEDKQRDLKQVFLREGMHVQKYDFMLGWVPGTMHKISHDGHDSLAFVADGDAYAPSPTWPDSRFRRLDETEQEGGV